MAARAGFEPTTLRTKGDESTNEPPCPTMNEWILPFDFRYKDVPDVNPIKCTFSGLLKDLFRSTKPKQPNKIYYQKVGVR